MGKKNGEKKAPKLTKTGKVRKGLPEGLERVTLFCDRVTAKTKTFVERFTRWSDKCRDQAAKERLLTMAQQLTEAQNAIDMVSQKAIALKASGFEPPKPSAYVAMPDFSEGDRVRIRQEHVETYDGLDSKQLNNMKVLKEVKQGKRTSYLVTGAGFVPKSHLESISAE